MSVDDQTRNVLAGLSFYVARSLPASMAGIAEDHGLNGAGWVFPEPLPSSRAAHTSSTVADLRILGASLRERATDDRIALLVRGDAGWPSGCDDVPCLWVLGATDLDARLRTCVAITGTRACTIGGAHLAAELARTLGDAGWAVVTGTGHGIDANAAAAFTPATPRPVVIAASGLDYRFGRSAAAVIARTARHGAVVSAFPPGLGPTPARWTVRDRMLGSMSSATIVVEAHTTSRALHTARAAAADGKPVFVVPVPGSRDLSGGCQQLVTEGMATLVANYRDILTTLDALTTPNQLYRIVAFVHWHNGDRSERHVPTFQLRAASAAHAANAALDIVVSDHDAPAHLTVGVLDPAGDLDIIEINTATGSSNRA